MEAYSSVSNLTQHLISSAIKRCRISGQLCRLTVALKSSPRAADRPPLVRISISDTGVGSCLEEFQDVKYLSDASLNQIYDGVISLATTSIGDNEIFHYNIDLKQKDRMKRVAKLPLSSKNGATFSGTEVSFSTFHGVDDLVADITCFFQKMLILKAPKVGIELIVVKGEHPVHQCVNAIVENEFTDLSSEEIVVCLESGLVDYVLKHGNKKDSACQSCFPIGEHLKTGNGVACKSKKITETMIEVVVIISELSEILNPSCFRVCGSKTEVLYFSDFSPGLISQPLLNALKSIDWKSYGLSLKCTSDENGCTFIEWEDLPPGFHIDIAIHCHQKNKLILPPAKASTVDKNLVKKAVKLALNDLKEKNDGVLLSAHAVKIRSYAPDLAKTIASLISTSSDLNFKRECASILGLHSQDAESIEDNLKQRLISVIDRDDRESQTKKPREVAPLLFHDDFFEEPEFMDEEFEDCEVSFSAFDL